MAVRSISALPMIDTYSRIGVRNKYNHTRRKNKSLGFDVKNIGQNITPRDLFNYSNIIPTERNKSLDNFQIEALIEQSFPPINTSSHIENLLTNTIKNLYDTSMYYTNIQESLTPQSSHVNNLEMSITKDLKKNIDNVYPILDDNDFYKLDAVERIELYNILENSDISQFNLYCGNHFKSIVNTKYEELYKSLLGIYKIIFSLPKGSVQHEHSFSIGYTLDFLSKLVEKCTDESYPYSVVYIYREIDHPHFKDALPHSLRIVRKDVVQKYEESMKSKNASNNSGTNSGSNKETDRLGPLRSASVPSFSFGTIAGTSPSPSPSPSKVSLANIPPTIMNGSSTGFYYLNNAEKSDHYKFELKLGSDDKFTVDIPPMLDSNTISINDLEDIFFITEENKELIYEYPWKFLEFIADRSKGISGNYDIQDFYLDYVAESCINENVQEIQIKTPMSLWSWDTEGNYKKMSLEESYNRYGTISQEIFTREKPVRISFIAGKSRGGIENYKKALISTYKHFEKIILLEKENTYKIITGYDIYSQEDVSNKNETFIKMFKKLESKYPEIAYVLHTGETNKSQFPADHNLIYAGLLENSLRVGHAVSLWKYPFLINLYKEKKIGIELCPLSNNLLGYVADVRNHPALCYINNNLSVSINTDNRGLLNYRYVTYDWMDVCLAQRFPYVILKNIAYKSMEQASRDSTYVSIIKTLWEENYNRFLESNRELQFSASNRDNQRTKSAKI
jgi:hypothetical protein